MRKDRFLTFTQAETDRFRELGFTTSNGVVYYDSLVSINGSDFTLIREGQDMSVLEQAAKEIYGSRDVIGTIKYVDVSDG